MAATPTVSGTEPFFLCHSKRVGAFATVGGMQLVLGLGLVILFEQSRPIVFYVYAFMSGVAPLLSAYVIYLSEGSGDIRRTTFSTVLIGARALLLSLAVAFLATILVKINIRPQAVPWWVSPTMFLASASAITVGYAAIAISRSALGRILDACLVVAVAIIVLTLSPLSLDQPEPVGLLSYAFSASGFWIWGLFGVAWTAAGVWLRRREGWAFPHRTSLLEFLAVAIVAVAIVGLYDDSHFVDFGHYAPLVGPAMHAMHGGIPMVDTYSQYGLLPWLIHRLAFAVFEPTFGTAAVVVRITNLCYFAVIAATLFFVSRRRLSALWFFIPAVLVAVTSHNPGPTGMWNMHALPMTLAGRWLLPASMTLLLVATTSQRWARQSALAIIVLAALSSTEILAFTLAPWGFSLLLESIRLRSLAFFLKWMAIVVAMIVLTQIAFAVVVFLSTGAVVDYAPYLNVVMQHRPSGESDWSMPFVPGYALWLPIGLAYFLVMAEASYRAYRRQTPVSLADRLCPVAVLGLGPLAYFFGRPQEGTLSIACLSFAVMAIGIAEATFLRPRRFGPAGSVLFPLMALAFAFVIADGFEHFMRPFDPSRGNATILRRCFTEQGCRLADVARNIDLALHTQPLDPRTKVGYYVDGSPRDGRKRIEEAISIARRHAPNDPYIGLLTDFYPRRFADSDMAIGMTVFMATGQWFPWGISSPANDGLSPLITDRIVQRVDATPADLLVVVPHDQRDWLPLNKAIFQRLTQLCRMRLVEAATYHTAFRIEQCK